MHHPQASRCRRSHLDPTPRHEKVAARRLGQPPPHPGRQGGHPQGGVGGADADGSVRVRTRDDRHPVGRPARLRTPRPDHGPAALPTSSGRSHICRKCTGSRGRSASGEGVVALRVHDPGSGAHPLGQPSSDDPGVAVRVGVGEWPDSTQVRISASRCGWSPYPLPDSTTSSLWPPACRTRCSPGRSGRRRRRRAGVSAQPVTVTNRSPPRCTTNSPRAAHRASPRHYGRACGSLDPVPDVIAPARSRCGTTRGHRRSGPVTSGSSSSWAECWSDAAAAAARCWRPVPPTDVLPATRDFSPGALQPADGGLVV